MGAVFKAFPGSNTDMKVNRRQNTLLNVMMMLHMRGKYMRGKYMRGKYMRGKCVRGKYMSGKYI